MRTEGRLLTLLFLLVLATIGAAQTPSRPSEKRPTLGQAGKDVIWLPTPNGLVERMLRTAGVGPTDYVVDLGSGDGRTVIMAAREFGARGLGIEYNPDLVALSEAAARRAGVSELVDFVEADIFESDFSRATVLTMYLLPSVNLRLRQRILAMRPGTRVLSNTYDMAEWRADDVIELGNLKAYLWIVPANLDGRWRVSRRTRIHGETWRLRLDQAFQELSGRVYIGRRSFPVADGHVRGDTFAFHFVDAKGSRHDIHGKVDHDRLVGTLRGPDGSPAAWTAEPGR